MPLLIRPATSSDQAAISAIVRAANINPLGLDWRRFLVAEENGEVVGIGQIKPHRDGSLELASIAVIPSRQREGIANRLITTLLDGQTEPIYLMCQQPLETFYQRFGFARITPAAMPPYFRRIAELAGLFAPLIRLFNKSGFDLVIMKRETSPQQRRRSKRKGQVR